MCSGDATVVPGALRGYRTWRIDPSGQLASYALPYVWRMSEQRAACFRPGYHCAQAPADTCMCGFYGWYSPHDTRLMAGDVLGAIEVRGRVLLGTHGFRAERARVLGLVLPAGPKADLLRVLCREQLVPTYASVDELVEHLPADDVSQLVGPHTCAGNPQCFQAELDAVVRASLDAGRIGQAMRAAAMSAQAAASGLAAAVGAKPTPPPVPVWKRRLAIAACALAAVICGNGFFGAVFGLRDAAGAGPALAWAVATILNAFGVVWWVRLLRRALWWGR
jgi:hypothetical protein